MKPQKKIATFVFSLCLILALSISIPGKSRETIAFVQHTLNSLGFLGSSAGGTYNARTKAAIKEYQRANNLKVNGKVTSKLVSHLEAALDSSLDSSRLKVHVLDMGEGQALLFESKGEYVLYDGGPAADSSHLITYLKKQKAEQIKYLICSHYDDSHLGGALVALYVLDVKKVFAPQTAPEGPLATSLSIALQRRDLTAKHPKVGKTYSFGKASFTILAPQKAEYEQPCDTSLALRLECKGSSLLLTGDAGKVSEKEMVKAFGKELKSDLLILSSPGGSKAFLNKVKPKVVLLTYGQEEKPSQSLKERLKEGEVELYRTDKQGDLLFWVGKNGWMSYLAPYKDYSKPEPTPTPSMAPAGTGEDASSKQTGEDSASGDSQMGEGSASIATQEAALSPTPSQSSSPTVSQHTPGDYSWALGSSYRILAYDEGIGHTYVNDEGKTYNPILGELGSFLGYNKEGLAMIRPQATVTPEEDIPPALPSEAPPAESDDYTGKNKPTYTYVVDKSTRIFHYSNCPGTEQIEGENKRKIFGTREELLAEGYVPCEECKP